MTRTGRRWMLAFMGALAAHVILFHTASLWLTSPRILKLDLAPGDEAMDVMLVAAAPPAEESASALPSPPASVPAPAPETRVEEKPVEKVPEPVKEPDPEPTPVPELKPVLTEPDPEAPAIVPPSPPVPAPEPQPVPAQPPASVVPSAPSASAAASSSPSESSSGLATTGVGSPESSPNPGFKGGSAPLSAIKPRYPMGSRIRGEEGPVRIRARVDRRGIPEEVTVLSSSGFPALDAAAVRAVKGARFVPPRADALPESYFSELTIRFQLKDP